MKTHAVELQRIKAIGASHGVVTVRVDAQVQPLPPRDGVETSLLSMSVENARVLLLLLKQQIAELEPRKGKSQR